MRVRKLNREVNVDAHWLRDGREPSRPLFGKREGLGKIAAPRKFSRNFKGLDGSECVGKHKMVKGSASSFEHHIIAFSNS